MPSLGDTYERRVGVASRKQVLLGTALFALGSVLVVLGILFGGTGLLVGNGFSVFQSREIAGILAGIGVPAVFVGITIVLPGRTIHRVAAVVGAGFALLGVWLFQAAYPENWFASAGVPTNLVLLLLLVYFTGVLITFWSLFTAVATFKTRNDPGGTVSLQVGSEGPTIRAVEAVQTEFQNAGKAISSGLGGIGTFGDEQDTTDLGPQPHQQGSLSDGGESADAEIVEPEPSTATSPTQTAGDAEVLEEREIGPDKYCGNCNHFEYETPEQRMDPYCGLYDEPMDDMEACKWWQRNA
ncbi:DUF7139 domain-containing protein [Halodesulfurarchaeum sp.]|uniref:DUF7139 domain-containing protein n=1 Tax=Halodesulfurarchaeum sp. TaxID=1980530 RepID=UPI001BB81937|nr:hypothetical protein [Halodesulfurarchaeum sp.]